MALFVYVTVPFLTTFRRYVAPPEMQARWKRMDPLNVFNPGIGGLPCTRRYGTAVPLQAPPPRS